MSVDRGALSSASATAVAGWSEALRQRRPVPTPSDTDPVEAATVSRRAFIRLSFWGGLGLSLAGAAGTAFDFLYPRNVRGFGGPVPAGALADYAVGADPVMVREAQAWLVNLDPSEDRLGGSGGGAGLLALWRRCPHLGCSVPWEPAFSYRGDEGWFRCPCHRSTYTKAGVLVFGPAPRSMDTMLIEVDAAGLVTVQTSVITPGGRDNPSRALPV